MARAKTSKSNNQGGNSSFTSQDDTLGAAGGGDGGSSAASGGKSVDSSGQLNDTLDKLAKAAMSKEMLAAGLAAAAAAIVVNQVAADVREAAIGLALVVSGLPVYWLWIRTQNPRAHK